MEASESRGNAVLVNPDSLGSGPDQQDEDPDDR